MLGYCNYYLEKKTDVFKTTNALTCTLYFARSWGARLRIREVTLNDAGAYLCVANNSEGTASTEAFLVVNGK